MEVFGVILILFHIIYPLNGEVHYVKLRQQPNEHYSCIILEDEQIPKFRGFSTDDDNEVKIITKNAIQGPVDAKHENDSSKIIEIFARKKTIAEAQVELLCKSKKHVPDLKIANGILAPEVVKIVDGGDQANRIDVVFMGDGYQESERGKFFEDIERLTKEMFEGTTFRSYLPLFNIWAIYEASVDSGIGYHSGLKNTPFQLYRDAGTLRGIYPGNAGHARTVCRLTGTSGCDYPSIIGNDDFYGGLGGEFVISTRSNRTGTVVLRHEMGHNFVDVGEEYDQGEVYCGVNSARSVETLGWTHWLSGEAREERAIYCILAYPWADLAKGPQTINFTSDGSYCRWYLLASVSAAGEHDCLEFLLDGEVLPWTTHGFDDREFYDWYGNEGFTQGPHTFSVRSKTNSTNPNIPRMICHVQLHEFGSETDFHMSNDYISAYPTFHVDGAKTFRPTNAGCVMRNMSRGSFCPVCREGMWYRFLERISLIDSVVISLGTSPRNVTLNTLKLGALRAPGNEVGGECLEVRWSRDGQEQINLRDRFMIRAESGSWTVSVKLITPEIRSDPKGLTIDTYSFTI
ncbi:unnamed protein product [Allacma fusca]|uniref:Uncharacterized protein n=1 Tax=Allacma fusca TaxID=39272 RepID=A0A8J2PTK6_9HEXA|nr:unnamed protein product [Allacma fusca]